MYRLTQSDRIYIGIVWAVLLSKVVLMIFRVSHPVMRQFSMSWGGFLMAAVFGFVLLKFAEDLGIPDLWDRRVKDWERVLLPAVLGAIFGLAIIVCTVALHIPENFVSWPLSVFVYLHAAVVVETLLHFLPIVGLTWLITAFVLGDEYRDWTYWAVAVPVSLIEPITETAALTRASGLTGKLVIPITFILIWASNLIAISLLKKYGFLAALIFRLSLYVGAYIIYGNFYSA